MLELAVAEVVEQLTHLRRRESGDHFNPTVFVVLKSSQSMDTGIDSENLATFFFILIIKRAFEGNKIY